MALTNAEKQAAWRERRDQRVKDLEKEQVRLRAEVKRLRSTVPAGDPRAVESNGEFYCMFCLHVSSPERRLVSSGGSAYGRDAAAICEECVGQANEVFTRLRNADSDS